MLNYFSGQKYDYYENIKRLEKAHHSCNRVDSLTSSNEYENKYRSIEFINIDNSPLECLAIVPKCRHEAVRNLLPIDYGFCWEGVKTLGGKQRCETEGSDRSESFSF